MGFMDKAKKLAEQAQEKLDEAQKNFNQGQGSSGSQPAQGAVQYDDHGRPIQQETPAAATPPPTGVPVPSVPTPDPTKPPVVSEDPALPAQPPPPREQSSGGDANSSPDPFKPLQQ